MNLDRSFLSIEASDQLLSWRNDSNVRKWSRTDGEITEDKHQDWIRDRLSNINREPSLLYSLNGTLVGTSRFSHLDEESFEISILVNPRFRGRGIGKTMLHDSHEFIAKRFQKKRKIMAMVHKENLASLRLFEQCGYEAQGEEGLFVTLIYFLR